MTTKKLVLPETMSLGESYAHVAKVQIRRRLTLWIYGAAAVAALPFVGSHWPAGSVIHETIEQVGLLLIIAAILGRAWCSLYIGGRKSSELVDTGPYSVSRNPLYLFSMLGVVGVGAQSGSLLLGPLLCSAVWLVFRRVIGHEEALLLKVFGEPFSRYCERVPRFGPRYAAWLSTESLLVSPSAVWRTVRDAIPFLLVPPGFELIDWLQATDAINVVLRLY